MHAGERRVVAGPDPRLRWLARVGGEAPHGRDVVGGVQPFELVVGRRLGRQTGLAPYRVEQLDPRPEPSRAQRMARPEVVRERARPEDQERSVNHGSPSPNHGAAHGDRGRMTGGAHPFGGRYVGGVTLPA